uniref:RING-type domain-containing protein n=1 Tax=Guillardia theta TaxID=55529 RepID=A0A6U6BZE7_GUITH|mmetsp:Transcript_42623/g.134197  ORF Transcript_42623/g.134197 Transcript_42623/m.134197 type:complete len:249 (+) Transcript_42623:707-1453(+)
MIDPRPVVPTAEQHSSPQSNSFCALCGQTVGTLEVTTECGHYAHSSCWQQHMAKHADLHKKTITCPVCSTNLNLRQLEHAHASPHMKSSHLNSISSLDDHLDDGLYPKCYQITDGKSHSNFDEDEIDSSVDTSTSSCPEEQSFLTSSYIASPNLKSDGICAEVGFLDNSIFTPYKQKRFIEIKSPPSARSQEGRKLIITWKTFLILSPRYLPTSTACSQLSAEYKIFYGWYKARGVHLEFKKMQSGIN